MGYYTISIPPASQDMMTIVAKFDKFRYNSLLVGIFASGNKFQAKSEKLLSNIEVVETYIYDILVLRREISYNCLDRLRVIFSILSASGL